MLSTFLAFLGGPIVSALVSAYRERLAAGQNADKIAAELAVQQAQVDAQREAIQQQTLVAEEGRWGPFVRWGFALPFILFNAKAIVWDRMLHLGMTDPLSPELLALEQIIIAAYFGHSAIVTSVRAYARRRAS